MPACPTAAQDLHALAERHFVPLNMMLELTYRCNESCLHCYLPETQGARPVRLGDELSADEWCRVLGELAAAGTFYLILSGGEVLLKEGFDRIVTRARDLHFDIEIFTNATLVTPEVADFWAREGVSHVGVSLYSPDAVWQDRMTRLKGSYEATLRGVRLLAGRGLRVKLKSPLMKMNLRAIEAIKALAGDLGVAYQFDPILVPRNDGWTGPTRLGISDEDLAAAYRDESLSPDGAAAQAIPLPSDQSTCSAGRTSGAIGPYGVVVPCIQWMVPAGNVRRRSFSDIWKNAKAMSDARRYAGRDVKPCPDCGKPHFVHCLGTSQLERGDPLIPSSECCRLSGAMRRIQEDS